MKKRKSDWSPTKYELHRGHWRYNRAWGVDSRLMSDLQADGYQTAISKYAHGSLVDLGCGNAPLCGMYKPLVTEYTWADWPNSAHQMFDLDLEVDLNGRLPFASARYDTILLSDVMEHIAEPDLLFSELVRIARPGGSIIVGVPFFYWLHEEPHDFHRYTKFKLKHFGEKHGAPAVDIWEAGGAFDVWSDLTSKLVGAVWKPLGALPYYAWKAAKAVGPVRRLNAEGTWRFPLAYVAVFRKPAAAI
jgi:SAM-dependent methyltransferase